MDTKETPLGLSLVSFVSFVSFVLSRKLSQYRFQLNVPTIGCPAT
jgi:hypothetical protein